MSPSDYEALSEVLTFTPCDTQHCVNVSITDDLVNEPEETVSISLNKISSFVTLSTTAGEVIITDDDGKEFKSRTCRLQDFQKNFLLKVLTAVKCVSYLQKFLLRQKLCSYLQINRKESGSSQ